MIRLILMRHGNTFERDEVPVQIGARMDPPLTLFGRKQAEQMGSYLITQGIFPKAIYAGKLKRQIESAKIIAQYFALPLLYEPALTEINYGPWEGLTGEEIARHWPKEHAEWSKGKWQATIFGEKREERRFAIENWLKGLRRTYQREDTLFGVTSNGLLRFLGNEKVRTGHFCEIALFEDTLKIGHWNIDPQYGVSH